MSNGWHLSEATRARIGAASRGRIPWNKGKHLSEATRAKMSAARRGKKSPHWKGGKPLTSQGYRLILKPDHPAATKAGYIPEHRLIAEAILGRPLDPREVIHHDNGNKLDQRRENLIVCEDAGYHRIIHVRHLTPATIDRTRATWLGEARAGTPAEGN